jgi:hypothetical protein
LHIPTIFLLLHARRLIPVSAMPRGGDSFVKRLGN